MSTGKYHPPEIYAIKISKSVDDPTVVKRRVIVPDITVPISRACCRFCGKQFGHNYKINICKQRLPEIGKNLLDVLKIPSALLEDEKYSCLSCWWTTMEFVKFSEHCRKGQQQLLQEMIADNNLPAIQAVDEDGVPASTDHVALNEYESRLSDQEDEANETTLQRAKRNDRHIDRLMLEVTAKKYRIRHGAIHECMDCLQVFPSRRKLLNHRKSCALIGSVLSKRNGPYKCQHCDMVAKTLSGYRTHLLHKHNLQDTDESWPEELRALRAKKTVMCPICSTSCQSLDDLKEHLPTHKSTGQPSATSTKAPETATDNAGLLCYLCGKSFRSAANCQAHMNYHLKNKRYVCELCGKQFYSKSVLHEHRKCVHEHKRFECNVCGTQMLQRINIQRHDLLDDVAKQLHCSYCNRSFTDTSTFRFHTDIHLDRKRFRCEECGDVFLYRYSYRQHILRAHGIIRTDSEQEEEWKNRPTARVLPMIIESNNVSGIMYSP